MPVKKNKYPVRITREAAYVEVVDAEIIAEDEDEAYSLALAVGNGGQVDWPALHRYNTFERELVDYRFIEATLYKDEKEVDGP